MHHELVRRFNHLIRCRGLCPGEIFELEMIGSDDVSEATQPVAYERRDVGVDVQSPFAIPEHGVASIEEGGVARPGALDEVGDHSGDFR